MRTPPGIFRAVFAALVLTASFSASQSEVLAQVVGPGDVLISEFRLSGPGGPNSPGDGFADEYMEFYCNRDTDCDISDYNIVAFDPSFGNFAIGFPASGIIIPARGHLLVGDNFGYSLTGYADLDLIATFDGDFDFFIDNEGFQLRNADLSVIIDSVGFIGGGGGTTVYVEGTGLQRATSRPADQYAYVRHQTSGRPQDTNNNAADFVLVSVTGAAHPGITQPPALGAPGPENSISPIQRNATIKASLIDPGAAPTAVPNRARNGPATGPNAAFGTITFRRRFTNSTGVSVTQLRFRIVNVTAGTAPAGTADLRALSSGSVTVTLSGGGMLFVQGTTLETPPAQPNGGGLNSTLAAGTVTPGTPIANGATIDLQFVLGVQQEGTFRFLFNVEALPGPANLNAARVTGAASNNMKGKAVKANPSPQPLQRMMSERKAFKPSDNLINPR